MSASSVGAMLPAAAASPTELGRLRTALRRHDTRRFGAPSNGADAPLPGCLVIVCGSRLWGTATPQSDLDCVVVHGISPAHRSSPASTGKRPPKQDQKMAGGGQPNAAGADQVVVTTSLSGGYFDVSLVSAAAFENRCLALHQAPFLQYLCAPSHCVFYGGIPTNDIGDGAENATAEASWFAALRQRYRPDAPPLVGQMSHSEAKDTARVAKLLAAAPDAESVAKAAKITAHAVRLASVCQALLSAAAPAPHAARRGGGKTAAPNKNSATTEPPSPWQAGSRAIQQLSSLPPPASRLCGAIRQLADASGAPPLVMELTRILRELQKPSGGAEAASNP